MNQIHSDTIQDLIMNKISLVKIVAIRYVG